MKKSALALSAIAGFGLSVFAAPASALTVFSENSEGYAQFNQQAPLGDSVNAGIPKIANDSSQ